MFLSIYNWMLAHVPGFMRPAASWLIDGLRSITNYIAQRWAGLYGAIGYWWIRVRYWRDVLFEFGRRVGQFALWLVTVRIPQFVSARLTELRTYLLSVTAQVKAFLQGVIADLRDWAIAAVNGLRDLAHQIRDWAKYWLDKAIAAIGALIRALEHVLNGPEVLAEWLMAALWRAFTRYLRAQQDRIALWLTRESVAFTRWLTVELENIIMRWL